MALLKAGAARADTVTVPDPPASLDHSDPLVRRRAVRERAALAGAVPALIAHLASEPDRQVREASFLELATIGTAEAAEALARLLSHPEAEWRNGALEALVAMPEEARKLLAPLGGSDDPDVRIFAVLLAAELPGDAVTDWLLALLAEETSANVCSAAVEILGGSGRADALPMLDAIRGRFPDDAFLAFAVDVAFARIREG